MGPSVLVTRNTWKSSSRVFRPLERKRHRLHLHSLLDLQSSPTVLPSPLSHAVETRSPPPKHTINYEVSRQIAGPIIMYFGGGGGNRTHVQHAFTRKELQQFF